MKAERVSELRAKQAVGMKAGQSSMRREMKASKLIAELIKYIEKEGDMECLFLYDSQECFVEKRTIKIGEYRKREYVKTGNDRLEKVWSKKKNKQVFRKICEKELKVISKGKGIILYET